VTRLRSNLVGGDLATAVYDPRLGCEKTRLQVRDKKTRSRGAVALEGVEFERIGRILDFGGGAGGTASNLLGIIPCARLVGSELKSSILHIARGNVPEEDTCD
jgi:hypothetical protein